jgi:hemoglobin
MLGAEVFASEDPSVGSTPGRSRHARQTVAFYHHIAEIDLNPAETTTCTFAQLDICFRRLPRANREGEAMTGSEAVSERPSLYDRLGGVYSIATVVEDLIDQIMVDPRLNANPRVDEAHHKVPPAGFKYLVTEMLCGAAGGPQRYSGRSMESHRDMAITPGEWQAFMDDLQTTLDKFSVPAAEQAEVKALVESTRAAIVVPVV